MLISVPTEIAGQTQMLFWNSVYGKELNITAKGFLRGMMKRNYTCQLVQDPECSVHAPYYITLCSRQFPSRLYKRKYNASIVTMACFDVLNY